MIPNHNERWHNHRTTPINIRPRVTSRQRYEYQMCLTNCNISSKLPCVTSVGIGSLASRDRYNSSNLSVFAFSIKYFRKIDEMYNALRAFP